MVASVSRSVIPSTAPGALHLANAGNTNCTFTGNGFSISGKNVTRVLDITSGSTLNLSGVGITGGMVLHAADAADKAEEKT